MGGHGRTLALLGQNLLSPMLLAFCLGITAQRLSSDLRLPEPVHQGLTIYLLLAIGLKGGVALSASPLASVIWPLIGSMLLGAAIPLWCYPLLRRVGLSSRPMRPRWRRMTALSPLSPSSWGLPRSMTRASRSRASCRRSWR